MYLPIAWTLDVVFLLTVENADIIYLTEAGTLCLSNLFFTANILNVGIKWADIKRIFSKLYELTAPEDELSYQKLKSDAAIVKAISLVIIGTNISALWGTAIVPYIKSTSDENKFGNESAPLPLLFYQWYPWDTNTHPNWEISIFIELVRSSITVTLFVGFDTMLSGLIVISAGQFQLLHKYISDLGLLAANLNNYQRSDDTERRVGEELDDLLRKYVKRHNKLIQYV